MAEKRQKKQAAKAFEKETFSKDKEVTGVKHIEHRQDNTFSVENQFSASEKPVSNLPRDANHGSRTGKATSGHNVQKLSCDFSDIAYLIHHIIPLKAESVAVLDVFFNVKFILFVIIG